MKKIISFFILLFLNYIIFAADIDIQKIDFIGVNVANQKDKFDNSEKDLKFNTCYSAILPAGGIYSVTDNNTGKEAIIQIGFSIVNQTPYALYMPDYLFNFFSSTYDKKPDKINLKAKFIGWNKSGEESQFLDLQSLVIEPNKSISEISKNGKDTVYLQLGSYSFQQNAFPAITEMLPFLELRPHFYLIQKDIKQKNDEKSIFRILAGPYSLADARRIANALNKSKNKSVFIKTIADILKEEKGNNK